MFWLVMALIAGACCVVFTVLAISKVGRRSDFARAALLCAGWMVISAVRWVKHIPA